MGIRFGACILGVSTSRQLGRHRPTTAGPNSPGDGVMPSTSLTKILPRIGHCLAAAALTAGLALAAQPTAGATPDQSYDMDFCVKGGGGFANCCVGSGGTVVTVPETDDSASHKTCTFPAQPASQEGSTPPKAGITVTQVAPPPAAPQGPGPVFTPIPMAPNSGRG
jgi:hypothetical protein